MKPRVLVVQTGGTLAMGAHGATLSLSAGPRDLLSLVPQLAEIADLEVQPLFNLDSGDLQPAHWLAIARAVHAALGRDDLAGVVVTHGTDTMAYSASALAFLLGPLPKPVIFTGAQRPLADVRTDARSNLVDATLGATLAVPEVAIAFGSQILRGCRTMKADAWALDAFASPACRPLVELGIDVSVAPHVRRSGALRPLDERIEPRVLAVRVFPGLDPRIVIGALRTGEGVRGLVLEAYGTGNLPNAAGSSLIPALEEAAARAVPVVVVSQCPRGHVELARYEGGAAAARAGAIDGGDMTVEAALAKLMIGLGRFDRRADLRAFLCADVAGERTALAAVTG
ncbi:MAG: asparaginase [Deltaproteobacteria bacterium]|nr:asparaginase [Deltaproteobacteria bacterium]